MDVTIKPKHDGAKKSSVWVKTSNFFPEIIVFSSHHQDTLVTFVNPSQTLAKLFAKSLKPCHSDAYKFLQNFVLTGTYNDISMFLDYFLQLPLLYSQFCLFQGLTASHFVCTTTKCKYILPTHSILTVYGLHLLQQELASHTW